TISQISFDNKERVHNHILMCGDSASLIHPLCGNGMAMAIIGAKMVSEQIENFFDINGISRKQMELQYEKNWNLHFNKRLRAGRMLQQLLSNEKATDFSLKFLKHTPFLMKQIINATHGKAVKL
ncbi:MAG: FAD-dependent oxidoreductase, partial [Leeuwenhoekiella sp.]